MKFRDRRDAGERLAAVMVQRVAESYPMVFGLVRGGMVVAAPVATALHAPLKPLVVRKLGHPNHPEMGVGALAPDGTVTIDSESARAFNLTDEMLRPVIAKELGELKRRIEVLGSIPAPGEIEGRCAIVVDDGLATGVTAIAAGAFLRGCGAAKTVLAVPVCSREGRERLGDHFDEVVCLCTPADFQAVGTWYEDFAQTTDAQVLELLSAHRFGETGE